MSDVNLEQLLERLGEEPLAAIDWEAPEAGQFPPIAAPGIYEFVFKLREDNPFEPREIEKRKYLGVTFDADVLVNGETKTLTYQRVNAYKHEKVSISSLGELLRSLNLRPASNPPTNRDIIETLQGASGRARGRGEIAWRFYCKNCDATVATQPRKRKNKAKEKVKDAEWPRNADGTYQQAITCPKCGSGGMKQFGQAEFVRYFSPASQG